eukprot:Hpha_TRINITY_DN6934_c0_g1::TRINITY_DN6934_c0_g1_i1::g.139465::m.139465
MSRNGHQHYVLARAIHTGHHSLVGYKVGGAFLIEMTPPEMCRPYYGIPPSFAPVLQGHATYVEVDFNEPPIRKQVLQSASSDLVLPRRASPSIDAIKFRFTGLACPTGRYQSWDRRLIISWPGYNDDNSIASYELKITSSKNEIVKLPQETFRTTSSSNLRTDLAGVRLEQRERYKVTLTVTNTKGDKRSDTFEGVVVVDQTPPELWPTAYKPSEHHGKDFEASPPHPYPPVRDSSPRKGSRVNDRPAKHGETSRIFYRGKWSNS